MVTPPELLRALITLVHKDALAACKQLDSLHAGGPESAQPSSNNLVGIAGPGRGEIGEAGSVGELVTGERIDRLYSRCS